MYFIIISATLIVRNKDKIHIKRDAFKHKSHTSLLFSIINTYDNHNM